MVGRDAYLTFLTFNPVWELARLSCCHWFSFWLLISGVGLGRDVTLHLVAFRHRNEDHGPDQHEDGEEDVVLSALELAAAVVVLDEVVDRRCEEVPEGDTRQEGGHDDGLHPRGRLAVREVQARDRDHHLTGGDQREGADLPDDVGLEARGDLGLDPGGDEEGRSAEHEADADLAEGVELEDLVDARVDDVGEERDEDQDHDGVDRLNLRGEPLEAQKVSVHLLGLENPCRSRLVVEGPEHRDEGVDHGELADGL